MSRQLKTDAELLHPRRLRRPCTTAERKQCKEPSKAAKARWEPLIALCIECIMQNEHLEKTQIKVAIKLWLPKGWNTYGELPPEKHATLNNKIRTINAEFILLWLYINKYTEYNPNMIYKGRMSAMNSLGKIENELTEMLGE